MLYISEARTKRSRKGLKNDDDDFPTRIIINHVQCRLCSQFCISWEEEDGGADGGKKGGSPFAFVDLWRASK